MATVALKQRTDSYWELIKDADSDVKIELIKRLADALGSLISISQTANSTSKSISTAQKVKKEWSADQNNQCERS